MNDELRRKAVVRKLIYLGVILALFTVSMFWRGVFRLPVGDPNRASERDETGKLVALNPTDRLARLPIRYQAEDLELLEQDAKDPEVVGALAQVSLVGFRGLVVSVLWNTTINNQKRGEYHEMERNARLLTKLQPHFIEPWIFQAWNISYNVSVETDKLGDQYYYIARGITLLAEGDRVNTRNHRRGDKVFQVGSPDIRYQLGFYSQNKFTVADTVNTLYSLSQLSLLPPDERNPRSYRELVNGDAVGPVNQEKFRQFCEKNPQLVRRLKTKLNLKKPEQVMDFLEENWQIPARYDVTTGQQLPDERSFPVFPVPDEGDGADQELAAYIQDLRNQELLDTAAGRDALDIRKVARAWFAHAQAVVPPPKEGVPDASPDKDEYDRFRYRIPQRPALIVFRMAPARAQTYVAERLQKEGWFDSDSVWNPDAASDRDAIWFPPPRPRDPAPTVILKAGTNARSEWEKTYYMWQDFGRRNGLNEENKLRQYELALATERAGLPPVGVPLNREYTDAELAELGLTREQLNARNALMYYDQNRQITQYQGFLDKSLAEMEPDMARARQLFWTADELHAQNDDRELDVRIKASALWRRVLSTEAHREFYQSDRAEDLQKLTLDQELAIADLLAKTSDPQVTRRVQEVRDGVTALAPLAIPGAESTLSRLVSEDEAQVRIALAVAGINDETAPETELRRRAQDNVNRFKDKYPNAEVVPTIEDTARGLIAGEFSWMKEYTDLARTGPWVRWTIRYQRLVDEGLVTPPESGVPPGPGVGPDGRVQPIDPNPSSGS